MKQEQIVIRGINPELVRRLKVQVAEDQETIKGYVLGLLKRELRLPVDFEVEAGDGSKSRTVKTPVRREGSGGQAAGQSSDRTKSGMPAKSINGPNRPGSGGGGNGQSLKQDTCPYHRSQVLVQSKAKSYRAECPQCHEDFEKRAGFSYEVV